MKERRSSHPKRRWLDQSVRPSVGRKRQKKGGEQMTNVEIKNARRWTRFSELDQNDYYCRHTLLKFVETGRPDPVKEKHCFQRIKDCNMCLKCTEIRERRIKQWLLKENTKQI